MFDGRDQPRSFHERGVAAPFTTPRLTCARLRLAPGRQPCTLELLIPNTIRGRGHYVLPWEERAGFGRVSLFDNFLGATLAARADLDRLCPAMVRAVAREVARQGYAGQDAVEAAARAAEQEAHRRAALSASLPELLTVPRGDRLLGLLADLHDPLGDTAPLPRLCDAVGAFSEALAGWTPPAADARELDETARTLATAATTLQAGARRLLHNALQRLGQGETPGKALAQAWTADPAALETEFARADWLLDGWERMVLLWRDAGGIGPGLLRECAALLPLLPDAADSWLGMESGACAQAVRRPPHPPAREDDAGQIFEQTLRNERLWRLMA